MQNENEFTNDLPEAEIETEAELEVLDAPAEGGKNADADDKYRRCLAEFDNFRKRTAKEMLERRDDGIRAACEKLLPVIDNFERALASAENKDDGFYKGIEMIARQFDSVLEELGVKLIETAPGTPFDTNLHYAVAHITDEGLGENSIADTMQNGYILKERVIRPAMVRVAN